MRTQKRTNTLIVLGCILLVLVCLITITTPRQKEAFAFTGHAPTFTTTYTRADFLSETNTFNAATVNQSTLEMTYNMNARNNNTVMAVPQITVLTHGLSGSASHWSNEYSDTNAETDFAYDQDSLINKLSIQAGGANVYWAVMKNDKEDFNLYDITNEIGAYEPSQLTLKNSIDSVSSHIIVVFEAKDNGGYNDSVYYEFNFMLSRIVYDVKYLNGGILPKINLIGHSRGGITNLQYALDHPDLVASLVSMGTPYFGTTTGVLATLFSSTPGREDVTDFDKISEYNNR